MNPGHSVVCPCPAHLCDCCGSFVVINPNHFIFSHIFFMLFIDDRIRLLKVVPRSPEEQVGRSCRVQSRVRWPRRVRNGAGWPGTGIVTVRQASEMG